MLLFITFDYLTHVKKINYTISSFQFYHFSIIYTRLFLILWIIFFKANENDLEESTPIRSLELKYCNIQDCNIQY